MTLRLSRILLVAAVALFYTLLVFNNLTDYGSNYQFVHHVLLMDSTFPGNHGTWRAIHPLWVHAFFYDTIIAWEALTMLLLWAAVARMLHTLRRSAADYRRARNLAIAGLTLSLLLWLVAFLSIGGEWFLMWQSHIWNGQEAAFRMFTVVGIVFILLLLPDPAGAEMFSES